MIDFSCTKKSECHIFPVLSYLGGFPNFEFETQTIIFLEINFGYVW